MGLDIKIPIGLLFFILGVLLTIYGLTTIGNIELYARSMNININLWTGLTMVVIGIVLLATAKYRSKPAEKKES
jgi:Na+/H+ antiporter NhaD/arsenite permease-like protein